MNKKFSHDGESIPNFLFISKIEQSWILGVPKAKRVQNFLKGRIHLFIRLRTTQLYSEINRL